MLIAKKIGKVNKMNNEKDRIRVHTGPESTKDVTPHNALALVLWMVEAVNAIDVKPVLPLHIDGELFCWKDSWVIKFPNQTEALSTDSAIASIKHITDTLKVWKHFDPETIYPEFHDYWSGDEDSCQVSDYLVCKLTDDLVGYVWEELSLLPVALRISEDKTRYYPVIGKKVEDSSLLHYTFDQA